MNAETLSPQQWQVLVCSFSQEELDVVEASASGWTTTAKGWRAVLADNDLEPVAQLAYAFLGSQRIEIDPDDPRFKRFACEVLRDLARIDEINAERERGHYREDEADVPLHPVWGAEAPGSDSSAQATGINGAGGSLPSDQPAERPEPAALERELAERFEGVLEKDEEGEKPRQTLTAQSLLSEAMASLGRSRTMPGAAANLRMPKRRVETHMVTNRNSY